MMTSLPRQLSVPPVCLFTSVRVYACIRHRVVAGELIPVSSLVVPLLRLDASSVEVYLLLMLLRWKYFHDALTGSLTTSSTTLLASYLLPQAPANFPKLSSPSSLMPTHSSILSAPTLSP